MDDAHGAKKLLHTGLTVTDLDRSLTFYRDVVGMTQSAAFEGHNDWFDRLTNNVGTDLRVAHLRLGSFELQLIEYRAGGSGDHAELAHNRIGSPHLCFLVDDVEAKFASVRARGDVTITSEVTDLVAGARSFYTTDPDGVPVEFVQVPRRG